MTNHIDDTANTHDDETVIDDKALDQAAGGFGPMSANEGGSFSGPVVEKDFISGVHL